MNFLERLETTLRVRGGYRLSGEVATHGAKNAALPIMAAALLTKGTVTLHGIPRITDVSVMWSLLEALGARLRLEGEHTITIDSSNVATHRAPYTLVRKLAASFDVTGPLLGRFGRAEVPLPGGCVLGTRAIDMHEAAFRTLGARVTNEHGFLVADSGGKAAQRRADRTAHAQHRCHQERHAGGGGRARRDGHRKCRRRARGGRSVELPLADGREDQGRRDRDAGDPGRHRAARDGVHDHSGSHRDRLAAHLRCRDARERHRDRLQSAASGPAPHQTGRVRG